MMMSKKCMFLQLVLLLTCNGGVNNDYNLFAEWFFQNITSVTILADNFSYINDYLIDNSIDLKKVFEIYNGESSGYIIKYDDGNKTKQILRNIKRNAYILIFCNSVEDILNMMYELKLRYTLILHENTIYNRNVFTNVTNKFDVTDYNDIVFAIHNRNYHKYPLNGTLFGTEPTAIKLSDTKFTGLDPIIFRTICNALNMTFSHHQPSDGVSFGVRYPNGTATGSILALYSHTSNITMNQMFVKDYNTPQLTFTSSIVNDRLCVIVPKAKRKPDWSAVFAPFNNATWLCCLVVFCICSFALKGMKKVKYVMTEGIKEQNGEFLETYREFISAPPNSPVLKYNFERIFRAFKLMFAIVISASFQGSLINVIREPRYYADINTLEALDRSNYKISISAANLLNVFSSSEKSHMISLDKKLILLPKNQSAEAYLSRELSFNYQSVLEMVRLGSVSKHLVKECPQNYILSYLVWKDAIFLSDVNFVLNQISAAGLIYKWRNDINMNVTKRFGHGNNGTRNNTNDDEDDKKNNWEALKLTDLQTSFYLLVGGIGVCFVIFISEFSRLMDGLYK